MTTDWAGVDEEFSLVSSTVVAAAEAAKKDEEEEDVEDDEEDDEEDDDDDDDEEEEEEESGASLFTPVCPLKFFKVRSGTDFWNMLSPALGTAWENHAEPAGTAAELGAKAPPAAAAAAEEEGAPKPMVVVLPVVLVSSGLRISCVKASIVSLSSLMMSSTSEGE
jgi:hypothetical protein